MLEEMCKSSNEWGAICSTSLSSDASATNWWACAEPPQDLQEVPEGREKCLFSWGVHASTSGLCSEMCWCLLTVAQFFLGCAEGMAAYVSWIFIWSHSTVRWQFLLTLWGLLTATPWHDTYGRPEIWEFAAAAPVEFNIVQCLMFTKWIERIKQQTWSRSNKMSYSKEPPTPH